MIEFQKITPEQIAYEQRRRAATATRNGPVSLRAILVLLCLFFLMWLTTFLKDHQKVHTLPVAPVRQQPAMEKSIVASTSNFSRPHHSASHRKTESQ